MPWYAPGPGQWPHWAATDSALEHSFQSMGWVETDGTIPTPGVPPDPAAVRLVKTINGKLADTTGGVTLAAGDVGAIPVPDGIGAQVGQVLAATQVDGTGKPTAFGLVGISPGALGIPATNLTPANTERIRAKLNGVRAGTGTATVLCIGDSLTMGAGNTWRAWIPNSYPHQLAGLLNSTFAPTTPGVGIAPLNTLGVDADPRFVLGTGWGLHSAADVGWGSGVSFRSGDGTIDGDLTFTPGVECDAFDVWYTANSNPSFQGAFDISVDGGAVTSVAAATPPPNKVLKATISTTLGSSHVLTINPTSGLNHIIAVEAYKATGTVRIGNAGVLSSQSSHWINDNGGFAALDCIRAYAPDLSIIMLGTNDIAAARTAAAFKANMRTLVAAARASGDVLLMSPVPADPAIRSGTLQVEYRDALLALSRETGSGFIDVRGRFVDYATAVDRGWMADQTHADADGYAQVAMALRDALYLV